MFFLRVDFPKGLKNIFIRSITTRSVEILYHKKSKIKLNGLSSKAS